MISQRAPHEQGQLDIQIKTIMLQFCGVEIVLYKIAQIEKKKIEFDFFGNLNFMY